MRTKICHKCEEEKQIKKFNKNKAKKDGLQSQCAECNKKNLKAHYRKNKVHYFKKNNERKLRVRAWFKELRAKSECYFCGKNHPAILDWHHTDPSTKLYSISEMTKGYTESTILKEMAKCIVLCSNCHRILHYNEKEA